MNASTLPGMGDWLALEAERLKAFIRGGKRQAKALRLPPFRARVFLSLVGWNKYCNGCHARVLSGGWAGHVSTCPTIAMFVRIGGCFRHADCVACPELGRACALKGRPS